MNLIIIIIIDIYIAHIAEASKRLEAEGTNCLKYCCLHVLPRFWDTLPRPITELCIDINFLFIHF